MDDDHLGAIMAHQLAALLGDRIGHDDDGPVALDRADERKADALVAAGRFHDDGVRFQHATRLGVADHIVCRAGLDRTAHVQPFKLHQDFGRVFRRHVVQPDNRRMPHRVKNVVINHLYLLQYKSIRIGNLFIICEKLYFVNWRR